VKLLYLSRLPSSGFFSRLAEKSCTYQLSVHVGEDARSDPPSRPGRYSTSAVEAAKPQLTTPEEASLRARINQVISEMQAAGNGATAPAAAQDGEQPLECRFRERVAIRLEDAGPGPAAGGPSYFRVDVWEQRQVFGRPPTRELWARTFVPLTEPQWQRRPCTWPALDASARDVAYLTCEFAFVHAPGAIQGLEAELLSEKSLQLSWRPLPSNRAAPLLGYRVEVQELGRASKAQRPTDSSESALVQYTGNRNGRGHGESSAASGWRVLAEVEPSATPSFLAENLTPDTRYQFRIRGFSEAGFGEAAEAEGDTPPSEPSLVGRPRLAACHGVVVAIEWDSPEDSGGAEVQGYRVWVRPDLANQQQEPLEWMEVGRVRHNPHGVQRLELNCEELDSSIPRYLCSVAAVNSVGAMGPRTPEAVCLPFPNPCAVCHPVIPPYRPALYDEASTDYPANPHQGYEGLATVTIWEPGKRPMAMPLLPPPDHRGGVGGGDSRQSGGDRSGDLYLDWGGHSHSGPENFREPLSQQPSPPMTETLGQGYGMSGSPNGSFQHHSAGMSETSQRDLLAHRLEEVSAKLELSLMRCSQVNAELSYSPDNHMLRQSQEEAEIEAAGLQAEVAVLSQQLAEMDSSMMRRPASPPPVRSSFHLDSGGGDGYSFDNFR